MQASGVELRDSFNATQGTEGQQVPAEVQSLIDAPPTDAEIANANAPALFTSGGV